MDAVIEEWYPKNVQNPEQSGLHASFRAQTDEERKNGVSTYPGNEKYHSVELLKYHRSWEWLMMVVEKIESTGLGYEVEMSKNLYGIDGECYGCIIRDQGNSTCLEYEGYKSKITSVYEAVVGFIEWYNHNNQLKK